LLKNIDNTKLCDIRKTSFLNERRILMLNFLKDESGQTILEYALIVAVLILVIIAAIPNLRNAVTGVFTRTQTQLAEPAAEE
jgi:pilus assembly protein Flp/PilA